MIYDEVDFLLVLFGMETCCRLGQKQVLLTDCSFCFFVVSAVPLEICPQKMIFNQMIYSLTCKHTNNLYLRLNVVMFRIFTTLLNKAPRCHLNAVIQNMSMNDLPIKTILSCLSSPILTSRNISHKFFHQL